MIICCSVRPAGRGSVPPAFPAVPGPSPARTGRSARLGAAEHLRMAGAEPVALAVLVGNGAGEILHDRPARVGAELVPRA